MSSTGRTRWQHVTALVSLTAGGAITGFSFAPGTVPDLTSPTGMPISLLAMRQSIQPAQANDAMLRSAIVNVANYYLRMAKDRTPAEMQAIIWQNDSIDGADHGQSCAAFASLTLELAAQVVGRQSWVTGGTSYPWPLHEWADVRVDPNPASSGVISIRQDAESHHRWHPIGDGYEPLPGDWVLFSGHVEVVRKYAGGVLHTVGGDSLPNFSVNAHRYPDPLSPHGVVGFVNNGELPGAAGTMSAGHADKSGGPPAGGNARTHSREHVRGRAAVGLAAIPGTAAARHHRPASAQRPGRAAKPAIAAATSGHSRDRPTARSLRPDGQERSGHGSRTAGQDGRAEGADAGVPGAGSSTLAAAPSGAATSGAAAIPGLSVTSHRRDTGGSQAAPTSPYRRHHPSPATTQLHDTNAQQSFIGTIAQGAAAAQRQYGVPAAVTIAQAIDESGWGQSNLATKDHNLFGIKGTGPAGGDSQQTQEYVNGHLVTRPASFRVYHNITESIDDHGKLIATSGYYTQAMADRHDPNAFAAALTGVYATDPEYGAKLIGLMRRYNLYRYDIAAPARVPDAAASGSATIAGRRHPAPAPSASTAPPAPSRSPAPSTAPGPIATPQPALSTAPIPGTTPAARTAPAPSTTPEPSTAPAPSTTPEPAPSTAPIPGTTPAASTAPARSTASAPSTAPESRTTPERAGRPDADPPVPGAKPATQAVGAKKMPTPANRQVPRIKSRTARTRSRKYQPQIPRSVRNVFVTTARAPLIRAEQLYRDVGSSTGIRWELLAACDWMQCEARPRYSPVYGEKLGTQNPGGTVYRTKSAALERCADDLAELAMTVYGIDLTSPDPLSIRDLASVFAAFRWGGLLKLHHTSAMEFPYSVAGLTDQHTNMRWPNIAEPNTPDKPGSRFRMPLGAVPVVLSLNYPATD